MSVPPPPYHPTPLPPPDPTTPPPLHSTTFQSHAAGLRNSAFACGSLLSSMRPDSWWAHIVVGLQHEAWGQLMPAGQRLRRALSLLGGSTSRRRELRDDLLGRFDGLSALTVPANHSFLGGTDGMDNWVDSASDWEKRRLAAAVTEATSRTSCAVNLTRVFVKLGEGEAAAHGSYSMQQTSPPTLSSS